MILKAQADILNYPEHIAIIMDGNGRWAKQQGCERSFGHQNGIRPIRTCMEVCKKLKIKYLTLYAFSTENWKRPKEEVNGLWQLLAQTIKNEMDTLIWNRVRFNVIGNTEQLNEQTQQLLHHCMETTIENQEFTLTLALNYGSRNEIVSAIKNISQQVAEKKITLNDITEAFVSDTLMTSMLPNPDLIIRTGGEIRLSNFLLWQAAYAELYFTPVLWPDFNEDDFYEAINTYQQRERRLGAVITQ